MVTIRNERPSEERPRKESPMNEAILQEISDFCRQSGLAESTFGRRAVNDGKLASRLRNGGRITTDTLDRIRGFMASHQGKPALSRPLVIERSPMLRAPLPSEGPVPITQMPGGDDPQRNFRFFDNRQKYLLFVNTCSEKWVVASRVSLELGNIHPRPPAVRVFDAGVGDGSVLTRVMRSMHDRFTHMPFYVVGKEISLEDVRLTMQKMADRFLEHPQTVLVLTNLAYADAPWLAVKSLSAASSMVWHELPLSGSTAHNFESQIMDLEPFLADNWKAGVSPKTGNPVYERPVVLVVYRDDHKFLLDPIIPKPGGTVANYDLVMSSCPGAFPTATPAQISNVVEYVNTGGSLMVEHYDSTWISSTGAWPTIASFVDGALRSMPEHLRLAIGTASVGLGVLSVLAPGRTTARSLDRSPIAQLRQYVRVFRSLVLFAEQELPVASSAALVTV